MDAWVLSTACKINLVHIKSNTDEINCIFTFETTLMGKNKMS